MSSPKRSGHASAISVAVSVCVALVVGACGDDDGAAVDGSRPDGGSVSSDAGQPDAGPGAMDGGAVTADAGVDAGAAPDLDAGPASSRLTARPLGSTAAGNGFYEYLPPGYGPGASVPLLVFWHGIGENGNGTTELDRVVANGPPRLQRADMWPNDRPFVVLSPQHAGGGCPSTSEIYDFIAFAMSSYEVDPARIYLTGLSCGAIGSWGYLGAHRAEQVVAAVLIAGDGRGAWSSAMCGLGDVAIWALHGDADPVVAPAGSIDPMTSLIACPMPPRRDAVLTIYPGVGHDSWSRTYDLSAGHDIYTWLLAQTR